ncbi:hypothetical protein [Mycobacterium marinum]|uniref:hypothetical protein n=1 Tax=Mycobacterium marinum TaxID=1781 RepID=UPI0035619E37
MVDDSLRKELQLLAESRSYRNNLRIIIRVAAPLQEHPTIDITNLLSAILLIEMHQRPGVIRGFEWIVSIMVPKKIRRPITRGPLQIADGPWNTETAIRCAAQALLAAVSDAPTEQRAIHCAAVRWNGRAVRQPGSTYGYGEVLHDAYLIANRAQTDTVRDCQSMP